MNQTRPIKSPVNYPALFAGSITFLVYLATLAPGLGFGDAGEFGSAGHVFGVTHPPGNPLLVMLLRAVDVLTIRISPILAFNIFNAALTASGVAIWSAVASRVLWRITGGGWQAQVPGALIGLGIGTSYSLWYQATALERGFAAGGAAIAAVTWMVVRALGTDRQSGPLRFWLLACYASGLAAGIHAATQLILPSLFFAVAVYDRSRWSAKVLFLSVALYVVGLSTFLTMPVRSAHQPVMDWGGIGDCAQLDDSGWCILSGSTADNLLRHVRREYYAEPGDASRSASGLVQVATWWGYLKEQWHASCRVIEGDQRWWGILFAILGLIGAAVHAQSGQRASFAFIGVQFLMLSAFLVWFLDLLPVPSQTGEASSSTEARERDYFYMWGFAIWGFWAGVGALRLGRSLAAVIGRTVRRTVAPPRRRSLRRALPLITLLPMSLMLKPVHSNWFEVSRRTDNVPIAWAHDILRSVDVGAILVASRDDDIFPLWYAQVVEAIRPDVVLVPIGLLAEPWFRRDLILRGLAIEEEVPDTPTGALDELWRTGRPIAFALATRELGSRLMPERSLVIGGFAAHVTDGPPGESRPEDTYYALGRIDPDRHWQVWAQSDGKRAILRRSHWCDLPTQRIAAWYAGLAAPIYRMSQEVHRDDSREEARTIAVKVMRDLRVERAWLRGLWPAAVLGNGP